MATQQFVQPTAPGGWTRSTRALTLCALTALFLLFTRSASWFNYATVSPGVGQVQTQVAAYAGLGALLVALVVWHLFPSRSWPWLLLAGAVVGAVDALLWVAPELYADWMEDGYRLLVSCAPAFTVVGFLGAATRIWHAGQKSVAAAMTGAAMMIQLVGPVVLRGMFVTSPDVYRWVSFCLVLVAVAGAIIAVVIAATGRAPTEQQRPGWPVTLLGGLAAGTPLILLYWHPDNTHDPAAVGDYLLYVGLTCYAIGLLVGLLSGVRALLAGLAIGLIIGGFGILVQPVMAVLFDTPVALSIGLSLGAVVAGFLGALTRARLPIGLIGLGVVALGLLVMFFLFISDSPLSSYDTFTKVLTPILLVIGVVAGTSAIGSVGNALAEHAETPAVLAGLSVPFALGTVGVLGFIAANPPAGKAPLASMLPSVLVALVLAAALVNLLASRRTSPRAPIEPVEPVDVSGSSVPPQTR